ncbi:hypothetical protein [Estrella lausannensis]|uniref:Uncharacterized protein n=1 Tax=Estrella lausannensis TaxID=483423 RepID=A0A0H5DQ06_9BACT|nr:hypothetical protein [Estrella lausannensis]CRX37594.1 hypothetical protein ELAC_0233 [Estrella lausannensis]
MSINTHSTQVSTPSFPPDFIPYGVVVPNQPGPAPGHVAIAQTLLNLDPQSSEAPPPDALQSRSFTQIASTLPQETEMNQLSQEERDQIWVTEPKVTFDAQRNVKKVIVTKNSKEWARGTFVDDVIVKSTPKDYIADGENTEFYDENGNFICGIAYGVNVEMGAMKKLAPLANSSAQRGAAGGLIVDIEAAKEKLKSDGYHDIDVVGDGWALRYRKNEGKGQYSTFANRHYSTAYGVTGSAKSYIVDKVAPTKASGLQTLQPYFRLLTQCFMNQFSAQTLSHLQRMKECEGHYFFQPSTCFSSLVVNCHEINEKGEEIKNSRAAIHLDESHHPDAYEVMLTLKENIDGGDLYLPEYGILLKLKDRSVTCFNATLQKHTVTKIERENVYKSACRVTALAYMKGFSENALAMAKVHAKERLLVAAAAGSCSCHTAAGGWFCASGCGSKQSAPLAINEPASKHTNSRTTPIHNHRPGCPAAAGSWRCASGCGSKQSVPRAINEASSKRTHSGTTPIHGHRPGFGWSL